jgi:hypothetical protein
LLFLEEVLGLFVFLFRLLGSFRFSLTWFDRGLDQ